MNTTYENFEAWYSAADKVCGAICGLGIDDLPDGPSWDSWDAGMTPREYVMDRLESEGFPV
jgi:hypothetical protein